VRLNEIYGQYRDKVRFYVIYIREAHPDDGWRVPENLRQNIRFREPRSDAERNAVARPVHRRELAASHYSVNPPSSR